MPTALEEVRARLTAAKKRTVARPHGGRVLSSGHRLLNLACSGHPDYAFLPGHYYMLVGGSSAGKTWLLKQLFAEAAHNPSFRDYQLIEDNPERGALMKVSHFFGEVTQRRIQPPPLRRRASRTLEEFYDSVTDVLGQGRPVLYGLDSEDALPPEADLKKSKKNKAARASGETDKLKGTYGADKAKLNSANLRIAHNALEDHGSILIVIKQTRENIGAGAMFKPKTRSGGLALTFYATLELWFSVVGKIKRTVNGRDRVIGSHLKIEVKKNRVSGQDTEVVIPFYRTHGFDELGANIHYLVAEKHWARKGEDKDRMADLTRVKISAPEFGFEGTCERLAQQIQEEGREEELGDLVVQVWREVEAACTVDRKPRYT